MADLPRTPITRQEEYLSRLAGENTTLPREPITREEMYLEGAIARVEAVEEEVEEMKNNPDVADIVATYADLTAYDKTKLTDKDIIRVLADETHNNDSTYYRYDKSTNAFTYIGESKQYTDFVGTDGQTAGTNGLVPAPAVADAGKYLKADGGWGTPTDTTYSEFTGTDGQTAGTAGLVPAPATTDVDKFLKSDGTWAEVGGGSTINVVQTAGNSQTDVMSQKAATEMVYSSASNRDSIKIGAYTSVTSNNDQEVAIGSGTSSGFAHGAKTTGSLGVAVGYATTAGRECLAIGAGATANPSGFGIHSSTAVGPDATCSHDYSVALGKRATTTRVGELNVGTGSYNLGYNSTSYRVIGGVHDGQNNHDAATVAQGNTLSTSAPTASTEGVLGQLWTDTTNMHTYQCTAISNGVYTWTQRW